MRELATDSRDCTLQPETIAKIIPKTFSYVCHRPCPIHNPKHFKVQKRHLGPPENVPQKSMKWSEKCRFGAFQCNFRCFWRSSLTLGGRFLGILDFEMRFLEFQDFGFCMGSGRSQFYVTEIQFRKKSYSKMIFTCNFLNHKRIRECNFREINFRKKKSYVTGAFFVGKLTPKTHKFVCSLFWLECTVVFEAQSLD